MKKDYCDVLQGLSGPRRVVAEMILEFLATDSDDQDEKHPPGASKEPMEGADRSHPTDHGSSTEDVNAEAGTSDEHASGA